ncbi:MAG TPA: hypothetical protein VEO37_10635 [Thermoanaerobaculia bacterium]|nr:hypothetical protein [Thermoanaerobaculia bacterium]
MKISADRALYLSRMILRKLKENMNLVQKSDDETARRAIVRVLTEAQRELEGLEQKVQESLARRKGISPRDQEFQFSRSLEEELRKHGA